MVEKKLWSHGGNKHSNDSLLERMIIEVIYFCSHEWVRIRGDSSLVTWWEPNGGSTLSFHVGDTSSGDNDLISW